MQEQTNLKRRIPEWMRCTSCSKMTSRQVAAVVGTLACVTTVFTAAVLQANATVIFVCSLGILKGLIMIPFVVLVNVLAVVIVNFLVLIPTVDYSYLTTRFAKYLGPNIKVVIMISIPILALLYLFVTPFLVAILSVALCFAYPPYVTLNAQRQSAYRFVLLTSGWEEMARMTGKNIESYLSFFHVYVPYKAVLEAKKPHEGEPYDIHPGNFALALLAVVLGGTFFGTALILLIALKLLPMLGRAYANHASSAGQWFKGGRIIMIVGFMGYFLAIPIIAALAFPIAFCYGYLVAFRAGKAIVDGRGSLTAGGMIFKDAFREVNKGTSKFIFNQDVPFLVLPSSNPIHLSWLVSGIIPLIIGWIVNPFIMACVLLVSYVPCCGRAYVEIWKRLQEGGKASTTKIAVMLYLLLALLPAIVAIVTSLLLAKALLDHTGVFMVMNKHKSFAEGFRFIFGLNYRLEYALNAFAYRTNPRDKVHWASLLPFLREWARPYMNAAEFDYSNQNKPLSIVTQAARYRPAGLRKPKKDAEGRTIDMTRAGYQIPGVGMAPIINGQLGAVIPTSARPGEPLPAGTHVPTELVSQAGAVKVGVSADGSKPSGPAVEPIAASTDIKPRRWGCMCMASIDDVAPVKEEEVPEAEVEEGEGEVGENEDPHAADVNDVKIDIGAESKPEAVSSKPTVAVEAQKPTSVAVATAESLPTPSVPTGAIAKPIASTESPAQTQASEAPVTARPTLMAETPQKGAAAMPSEHPVTPPHDVPSPLSPAHEKANTAVKRAQAVLHAAATAAAMAKAAREARTTRQLVAASSPEHETEPEPQTEPSAQPVVAETAVQARPVRGAPAPAATPLRSKAITISEEEDDDDDDVFVLEPVVRPDLPDEWVAVARDGETYYVNYARNQSNWSIPPGY